MIQVYFDNTLVDCPSNWKDLESSLKYDETLRAVLLTELTTLEFVGSAYTYLDNVASEGYCNIVALSVQDNRVDGKDQEIINGLLFVSDITFNERTCTASVKVRDMSFYSKIYNNKSVEFTPDVNVSKNFESITAATVYNLDVYDLDNVLLRNNVQAYRMYEVMRVAVAFITDNSVGFASTLLDIGGEFEGLCVTNGYRLRTATTNAWPKMSFSNIIDELRAIAPIQFTVDNPYTAPVFRIELESYFQGAGTSLTIENIYEVVRKFAVDKLYANVHIGSTETDADLSLSFPETIKYVGFNDETYYLTGECNIDTTLELMGQWLRSSNTIERTAIVGSHQNDDSFFLMNSTLIDESNGRTTNTNFLSLDPPVYYYNETLTNQAIFDRYVGSFPSAIADAAGVTGDGLFKAYRASTYNIIAGSVVVLSFDYTNVSFNTGSYYDGTDKYTAQYAGVYDFSLFMDVNILTFTGGTIPRVQLSVVLIQFDSTGTQLRTITVVNNTVFGTGNYPLSGTKRVVMNAGDYLQVAFIKIDSLGLSSTGTITTNSYWECTANTLGSGVFKDYDYRDYPINIYEFDYPLTREQWQDILSSPNSSIDFAMSGSQVRTGYIREVKRNHATGVGSFKLINTYRQNAD
jgi:hypothetical protein